MEEEIIEPKSKMYSLKNHLLLIFSYLYPNEESKILKVLKCKLTMNHLSKYNHKNLVTHIIRKSIFGRKTATAIKNRKVYLTTRAKKFIHFKTYKWINP